MGCEQHLMMNDDYIESIWSVGIGVEGYGFDYKGRSDREPIYRSIGPLLCDMY